MLVFAVLIRPITGRIMPTSYRYLFGLCCRTGINIAQQKTRNDNVKRKGNNSVIVR